MDLYGPDVIHSDLLPPGVGPSTTVTGQAPKKYFQHFLDVIGIDLLFNCQPRLVSITMEVSMYHRYKKFGRAPPRSIDAINATIGELKPLMLAEGSFKEFIAEIEKQVGRVRVLPGQRGQEQGRAGLTPADLEAVVNAWDAMEKESNVNGQDVYQMPEHRAQYGRSMTR
jgi:hypothetical protein